MRLKPLSQQVIVITGASSGIGLLTARMAAARGARVVLVARSGVALARIQEEIVAKGGQADRYIADVWDAEGVKAAAAHAAARFGRIDTWINNAGVAIYGKLVDTPLDEHERLFRTNYFGAVNGAMAALPHLKRQGGALITVASIASVIPSSALGAYSASKHAIKAFIDVLRAELAEERAPVSVTLVRPSGMDTPIAGHAANHLKGKAKYPPPVYDPALTAEAILDAAQRPRRQVTVGGAGLLQTLLAEHFPRLLALVTPAETALLSDETKAQPEPSNLFEPVRAGQERAEDESGRRFSLYAPIGRHPRIATLAALGIAGAGVALVLRRQTLKRNSITSPS